MKKFLTVLLALSVVFTYSFSAAGSVFADTAKYPEKLTQAQSAVLTELSNSRDYAVKFADDKNIRLSGVAVDVSAAAYQLTAGDVYEDYEDVVNKAVRDYIASYNSQSASDKATMDGWTYESIKNGLESTLIEGKKIDDVKGGDAFLAKVYSQDYYFEAFSHQFPLTKDAAGTAIENIDLSKYSDTVSNPGAAFEKTYHDLAVDKQQELLDELDPINIVDLTSYTAIASQFAKITRLFKTNLTPIYDEDDATLVVDYKFNGIPTKEDEGFNTEKLETKKLQIKSQINAAAADYYQKALSAIENGYYQKSDLVKFTKVRDAFLETQLYLVEIAKDDADLAKADTTLAFSLTVQYAQFIEAYEDLAKYAEVCKMTTDKTGALIYDAEKIDKNLANVKAKLYAHDANIALNAAELQSYRAEITLDAEISIEDLDWAKNVALAQIEDAREKALYNADGTDKYYDLEKAQVNKLYDERIAAINSAATVAQAEKLGTDAVTGTIKTKASVETLIKGLSQYNTEFKKANHYLNVLNEGLTGKDGHRTINLTTELPKFYAEKGARTNAEIVALFSEVEAMLKAIPTDGEIADAAEAVDKMIKELPDKITLADKAAVKAAYEAKEDLSDGAVLVYESKLAKAISAVEALDKKAIDAMFKDLPKVTAISVADKAAVKAVAEAIDAFDAEKMYSKDYTANDITPYEKAVRKADLVALIAVIDAIPENPSPSDEGKIKAARAAYDTYVAEYTDYLTKDDARDDVANAGRLFTAEARVKAAIINATESLKISVSTKLYTKSNKIRVNWKVKEGDASAITGYQVYKSTKAHTEYKYMGKTTKSYMDNKKGLKKGKRFFYKVRAYVEIDGERYYSDWSNKGNRIYK